MLTIKERNWLKIDLNIVCIKCGNIGGGKLSTIGPGGTIPYVCPRCGNAGLPDIGGFEGYKMAFISVSRLSKDQLDQLQKEILILRGI